MTQSSEFNPPGRRHAINSLDDQFDDRQSEQIQRATYRGASGGLAFIQRDGQPSADTTAYPTLAGLSASDGDPVLIIKVGAGYVVIDRIVVS